MTEFFRTFEKPYWMVGTRDEDGYGHGYVYTNEEAALKAAAELGFDLIERIDPDGTKTVYC